MGVSSQPVDNLFVNALTQGSASTQLPANQFNDRVSQILKDRTKSDGALLREAHLLYRFKDQSNCGRVEFFITQPSSQSVWREMGGQLNICENAQPPMQACKERVLVPYGHLCADNSKPIDTEEIKVSVEKALASGSLSPEQVQALQKNRLKGNL
jgi:hypothetical protein